MGKLIERFIRHKTQQEAASAQKEAEKILSEAWEQKQILMKRAENQLQWERGRTQFHESGILGILQGVIESEGAYGYYVDPEDFNETFNWQRDPGNPYYYAELHLER